MSIGIQPNTVTRKISFRKEPQKKFIKKEQDGLSKKAKAGVFLSTLTGVSAAMLLVLAKKKCLKNPFKGLVSIKYDSEKKEIEKLISTLAIGSIGGGLLGGAIFDKENMNAKFKESIIQLIGNVATPLLIVSAGARKFNKVEPNIIKRLKLKGKIQKVPSVLISLGLLFSGLFLGNKIGNIINKKVFNSKDEERKMKITDLSPHIDDVSLVTALVASESKIGPVVSRFIPIAMLLPGYSTGIAQDKN